MSSYESNESDYFDKSLGAEDWLVEDELDIELDLYTAASIGHHERVSMIAERGAYDLDRKNHGGWTALMYASYIGHDPVVTILVNAGVSVNAKNASRQTPLMLAASCGNTSVAYLLLQAGAELEAQDQKGWTALFHATYSGHQNMVTFLLENEANPEVKENSRELLTPFMEAAAAGHEIIVQSFLQHGVDVNAKTHTGFTARSLASGNGYTKIVSLIDNYILGPSQPLRTDPGLEKDFGSSFENFHSPGNAGRRGLDNKLQEGPEAFAKLLVQANKPKISVMGTEKPGTSVQASPCPTALQQGSPVIRTQMQDAFMSQRGNDEEVELCEWGPAPNTKSQSPIGTKPWTSNGSSPAVSLSHTPGTPCSTGFHNNNGLRYFPLTDTGLYQFGPFPQAPVQLPLIKGNLDLTAKFLPGFLPPPAVQASKVTTEPKASVVPGKAMDLAAFLEHISLSKYLRVFQEQDVDLTLFLSLTDNDLREVGITLFGPRRKMTNAIARWHSNMHLDGNSLEQSYANLMTAKLLEQEEQLKVVEEQLEASRNQLVQEQELRCIAESALMEERNHWRSVAKVARDTHSRCLGLGESLLIIRQCQSELSRRLGTETQLSHSGHYNHLAEAFQEQLQLRGPQGMALQQLMTQQWKAYEDMSHLLAAIVDSVNSLQSPAALH